MSTILNHPAQYRATPQSVQIAKDTLRAEREIVRQQTGLVFIDCPFCAHVSVRDSEAAALKAFASHAVQTHFPHEVR